MSVLKTDYLATLRTLRKQAKRPCFYKYRKPWILLLGPQGSGKTSFINQANINISHYNETSPFHWLITPEAVCIDPQASAEEHWPELLKHLKSARKHAPINHVILLVDVLSLCQLPQSTLLRETRQQLFDLEQLKEPFHVTLVISKTDLLPGFNAYFSDLTEEDREQALGFSMYDIAADQSIEQHLQNQFHKMLKNLSRRLFTRLHHERSQAKRNDLKNFPISLERLYPTLHKLITGLAFNKTAQLTGVYFCSTNQLPYHTNCQLDPFNPSAAIEPINTNLPTTVTHKSYFCDHLLMSIMATDYSKSHLDSLALTWKRLIAYPIALIVIASGALMWHFAFRQDVSTLNSIQANLSLLQQSHAAPTHAWLVRLNSLSATLTDLNQQKSSDLNKLGLNQTEKIKTAAQAQYTHLIKTTFSSHLKQILTQQLNQAIKAKSLNLYSDLQTYLMLFTPTHFKAQRVARWFDSYWVNHSSTSVQQSLMSHLQYGLTHRLIQFTKNPLLITEARNTLLQLPTASLAYMLLKNEFTTPAEPLLSDTHHISGLNLTDAKIPVFYTIQNFSYVYNVRIPEFTQALAQSNWVLGITTSAEPTWNSSTLIPQLRSTYLNDYAKAWHNALTHIKLEKATQFNQLLTAINLLTTKKSPLWEMVNIIATNANLAKNNRHTPLHTWLQSVSAQKTFIAQLAQVKQFIVQFATAASPNNLAYNTALSASLNQGRTAQPLKGLSALTQQLPSPVSQWATQLRTMTWNIILHHAAHYVNKLWLSSALPECTANIMDKYPIAKHSKKQISLNHFNEFFGPQGTSTTFFSYYLQPFVNTSHFYWTWKKIAGISLPFSQAALDDFLRAHLIQHMFYANGSTQPFFQYTLTPESLSSSVSQFLLNMEGQKLAITAASTNSQYINWPGPEKGLVSYQFNTPNSNNMPSHTLSGPWAWLKLLESAHIQPTQNPKLFHLTFTQEQNSASFVLTTQNIITPFTPGILDGFKCAPTILTLGK